MLRTWGFGFLVAGCVLLTNACSEAKTPEVVENPKDAAVAPDSTDRAGTESALATIVDAATETAKSETQPTRVDATTTSGHDARGADAGSDIDAAEPFTSSEPNESLPDAATRADAGIARVKLPPPNGGLDYQLGGGYELPQGVTIVSRDRTDAPAPGAYNICYINGFQVQPGEEDDWDADLLLRDERGAVVIDEDWDEALLDVSSAGKRERIAQVIAAWINQCASDGFDAIEIDNLDTYARSDGRIVEDDAVEFIAQLATIAHAAGLAIAQKNSVELVPRRGEMNTDFVVSEECNAWEECDGYIEAYGAAVLMIEYGRKDFARGCELYGDDFSIVFRDRNLTTPGSDAYLFDGC